MKKLFILAAILVLAVGGVFADSVSSETSYDIDSATITEAVKTSLTFGPLAATLGTVLTGVDSTIGVDLTADVKLTLDALSFQVVSSYGVDSVDKIPLTLTAVLTLSPQWTVTAIYAFDNINGDVPEVGKATVKAVYSW